MPLAARCAGSSSVQFHVSHWLIRQCSLYAIKIRLRKGDKYRLVEISGENVDYPRDLIVGKLALELNDAYHAVAAADGEIFLGRAETEVSAAYAVMVVQHERTQRIKIGLLDGKILTADAPRCAVVTADKMTVRRAVDIGLAAPVAAISRRDECRRRVLGLNAAQTSVRDHLRISVLFDKYR